ncbi:MAG: hypothetical protein PHU14_06805 [Methylovulum sp.]|nr:hypothetical protein [Methylovulum sp.]
MSLSPTELHLHCQEIIKLSQRKKGIIILCEGNINEIKGRVERYRRLEIFPDANFYKACIPIWWTEKRPTFVPCGDRKDVIDTYFSLVDAANNSDIPSGIDKNKFFAIIDLDLQPHAFSNYVVTDTEALYSLYYQNGKFQPIGINQHSIFITGLIYKEAYFLVPDLQPLFDHHFTVFYNDQPLNLDGLYQIMAQALSDDNNLCTHFPRACGRLNHLATLDFTNVATLQESWLQTFLSANEPEKSQLIYALLTIHQVKDYWKAFTPKDTIPEARFKEQLTLAIGGFYSRQPLDSEHHLPCFFKTLSTHTL